MNTIRSYIINPTVSQVISHSTYLFPVELCFFNNSLPRSHQLGIFEHVATARTRVCLLEWTIFSGAHTLFNLLSLWQPCFFSDLEVWHTHTRVRWQVERQFGRWGKLLNRCRCHDWNRFDHGKLWCHGWVFRPARKEMNDCLLMLLHPNTDLVSGAADFGVPSMGVCLKMVYTPWKMTINDHLIQWWPFTSYNWL